jgi:hypothetical protein
MSEDNEKTEENNVELRNVFLQSVSEVQNDG